MQFCMVKYMQQGVKFKKNGIIVSYTQSQAVGFIVLGCSKSQNV